ncbi:outer membrane protein assembly factor BamD [Aquabacterium sp. J223]|uniref:outer membrane protein assembly factor BamD n=1 Tax=Aquabacterium sp. J223 TaxID=2898431 RepID=UPI003916F14E
MSHLIERRSRRALSATPLLLAVALVAGCSSTTTKPDDNSPAGIQKAYRDAREEMLAGNYQTAIKDLERLEGRAAGTLLAQQATLDLAYAQFKGGEKAQAVATLDRFIRLNPSSPALDYALYLRGVINFNDDLGFLGRIASQDLSERDQQASRDAYQSFKQLVEQFPQSRYAEDAQTRMNYITNALANYELHVARYYYKRGAYLAAANRAQQTVLEFQQSPAVEEALAIMVRSYDQLGIDTLRDDARRVLDRNFPNSRYAEGDITRPRSPGPWWKLW